MKQPFRFWAFATVLQLIVFFAVAQNPGVDTIRWSATEYDDVKAKMSVARSTSFISYGKERIQWLQNDGALVYDLIIKEIKGNWKDLSKDGIIYCLAKLDGHDGQVIIQRSKGSTILTLDFDDWASGPILIKYKINKIDRLKP